MIEKTHPGSVESSYSLTVRRTRQKLSRQRAARRKRRLTSVETNEDFAKFITKWASGRAKEAGGVNFDHLLVARLFLNCTLNRERFGMFEEVTKTLQMFNTSTIFDHELERLELLLKQYARHDAGEKERTIRCFEKMNNDYEQKTRLDLKMRHALAVQYEQWPLNRDGLVNFTMILNAVKGLRQHILGEEHIDQLYDEANASIQTKIAHLDQSIRLLNEYAKTACRFINFEIWRSDFFNLFESICDVDHRLDRARFIECLTRFYQQQCRLPERARLVPPQSTPQMNVNGRLKSATKMRNTDQFQRTKIEHAAGKQQKQQQPQSTPPPSSKSIVSEKQNKATAPRAPVAAPVVMVDGMATGEVLRPVLEDREKTFDSSVSVEFKVEGIC